MLQTVRHVIASATTMKLLSLIFNILFAILQSLLRKVWRPSKKCIRGETALVTGAGHGMGRLISLKLAALGAKVIVVDVTESTNLQTAKIIKESGGISYSYTCDLRKKEEIKSLANNIKKDVGDVHILVNNAGVVFNTDILSASDEMISTTFDVNILSHFWLIREFLQDMKDKNYGHILALASISGKNAAPYFIDYSSSKHAVVGLMEGLRRELRWQGKTGVKTTCVCPAFVNTGFVKNPRSGSHLLCPVLDTEIVVNAIMEGMLTDQPEVELPPSWGAKLASALLPDSAIELIFDYVRPECDSELKKHI